MDEVLESSILSIFNEYLYFWYLSNIFNAGLLLVYFYTVVLLL